MGVPICSGVEPRAIATRICKNPASASSATDFIERGVSIFVRNLEFESKESRNPPEFCVWSRSLLRLREKDGPPTTKTACLERTQSFKGEEKETGVS